MTNDFFLTEWFFYALRWLFSIVGNSYFLTILIVTLVLRLVQIFPDIQSRKTQRKQAAMYVARCVARDIRRIAK